MKFSSSKILSKVQVLIPEAGDILSRGWSHLSLAVRIKTNKRERCHSWPPGKEFKKILA